MVPTVVEAQSGAVSAKGKPVDRSEQATPKRASNPNRSRLIARAKTIGALTLYCALLVVASRWGEALLARGVRIQILTPPLNGALDWRPSDTALPALACGLLVVIGMPSLCARWRWSTVLMVTALSSLAWAITLALVDGPEALTQPLLSHQYLHSIYRVGDLGNYLRHFADNLAGYNIHTQGHPPGMVVVLYALHHLGFQGVRWNAALVFAGGAASIVAVLVAVREVAGEEFARRGAPFLVVAPAAVAWTSADPFFAGVSAWAVTLLILATGREGRRRDALAAAGGLLFAATAMLSYGLILLAVIPLVIACWRRRYRELAIGAAVVAGSILAVWLASGFWWWDGLQATRAQYFAGAGGRRPYDYFVVGNLAAFAVAIGPATAVAFARLRREPLTVLVAAAIGVVLLADVSGMSKAEVERIWLPFVPWIMACGAVLMTRRWAGRGWLALQVTSALVLAVAIRSPW